MQVQLRNAADAGASVARSPVGEGVVVIINGDAGQVRKHGPKAMRGLIERNARDRVSRIVTTDRHDLIALLGEAAGARPAAVAVIGGDGTAHAALETLTPLRIPTIPLPGGTMNRLAARVFGRANLEQCLSALADGSARSLAGGRVEEKCFFVAAGFGAWMQVQLLRERLRKPKSIMGVRAMLRMAPRQFADRVTWTVDGAGPLSHSTLIVGVGRIDTAFGFGLERHEPRVFDVAGADIRNWGDVALLTGAALSRRWRRLSRVTVAAARTLSVENNHDGTPALLDGEFHMLRRVNGVVFDADLGLVWAPHRRRAPW